jgi:hypothetical protein
MFEKASRLKLRFDSSKGNLTAEDLWDLPLTDTRNGASLNAVAKKISQELKAGEEEDFVHQTTKANDVLQLKLDIVKHVIAVRLAEKEEARLKAEKKEKKAQLLEIIARKQNAQLEGASLDELQKMLADL